MKDCRRRRLCLKSPGGILFQQQQFRGMMFKKQLQIDVVLCYIRKTCQDKFRVFRIYKKYRLKVCSSTQSVASPKFGVREREREDQQRKKAYNLVHENNHATLEL